MRVTYSAPNRVSHYRYAAALAHAGCLEAFVSGFSRFSPRAAIPEVGGALIRADHLQNLYLLGLKLRLPERITDNMAYWSKLWMDRAARAPAMASDLFLYYNGSGKWTQRRAKRRGVVCVVEAVNTHVMTQQEILREECARLKIPFREFPRLEVARRVTEYEEADAVLCPSQFVRDSFIERGIPGERIVVVPYGTEVGSAEPAEPGGAGGTFRVLYVGQLHMRKGLRYLVEAFARFAHPQKELVIVGPQTEVTGLEGMTMPPGVRFAGILKGKDLADAYKSATVFVLPTLEEGLALVMGEALSFGLPVVATVNSGAADLFTDGVEGWQVPIRDPGAIVEKLQMLADGPELLARMSAAALARSRALGGWEATGERLVGVLKKLVAR